MNPPEKRKRKPSLKAGPEFARVEKKFPQDHALQRDCGAL
jgi:hypothetical protein